MRQAAWTPTTTHLLHLVFLLLVLGGPAAAHATLLMVDIAEAGTEFPIEQFVSYIEDPDHSFQPESLLRGDFDQATRASDGRNFNFGITPSTYWLMFELTYNSLSSGLNDGPEVARKLLEINYPPLDQVTLFHFDSQGNLVALATGDTLPFFSRPIVHNGFLFPIEMRAGDTRRFLLKVNSEGSMRVPMTLWDVDYFHQQNRAYLILHGIYFGIIVLMFVYNLILFAFIRDSTYLHYIFYIASFGSFQANYSGFAFQYLWPLHPQLNNISLVACMFLVLVFAGHVTRSVLETRATLPVVDMLLRISVLISTLMLPLTLVLSYHLMLSIAIIMSLLTVAVVVVGASINSWRGMRSAQLFFLARFAFLVGAVVLGCAAAGLLPANFFTSNALVIGSAIEVTLLSLSLADRMNRIERDRTRAEQQARQALLSVNRTLLESNQIKDEFLNTISHEMRTPMHGVLSSIDHVRHETRNDRRQQFIDSTERSAQQMMMLIDSVLDYTELHSSSFKLEQEPFMMTRLVESLEQLFHPQAQAKGLTLRIEVQPDVPDLVIGDFRHTRQILVNLLSNAVKFTQQGLVTLTVRLEGIDSQVSRARIGFCVEDSGIGIAEGMGEVIFDRFRQLQGGFSRGFGGLGIGLATSKEICRLMQAELTYQSTPGQGSRFNFVVELPFAPRSTPEKKLRQPRLDWSDLLHNRVALIVEDNAVNQLVMKATLEKTGLQTLGASNGREAIEILLREQVDIILMDCQMPVMDGFEATRAIRQLASEKGLVPIIAITANAMSKDREHCVESGMNDYLSKPVSAHELKEKLLKWLPLQALNTIPASTHQTQVPHRDGPAAAPPQPAQPDDLRTPVPREIR